MRTSGYVVAAAFTYRLVPPLLRPPFQEWLHNFGHHWDQMSESVQEHFKAKAQYLRSIGLTSVQLHDWELLLPEED